MEQELFDALKLKFIGVSDATLKRIANKKAVGVKDVAEIPALVEAMTYDAVISSEIDFRITDANKKAVENYELKHGLKEGKPIADPTPIQPPTPADPNDIRKIISDAINAAITPLQEKVTGFEKEKTQSQLMGKLTSKLKEKGVSEKFYKGRNLNIESEDGIEQLATEIETDWNEFVQEKAEQGVVINIPQSSAGTVKEGEAIGKTIAALRNTETSAQGGKQI